MNTNFQMLKELLKQYHPGQRGMLSFTECNLIRDTLHVLDMDVLQLRNLRDFSTVYLSKSDKMEDWDRMSAIATVIDMRINELGGEV